MKKNLLFYLFIWSSIGFAQQDFVLSGGDATGTGGSVSFSFGQTAITEISGSGGSMSQGVQQSVEIYTLPIAQFNLDYQIGLFPNPAVNSVTLQVNVTKNVNPLFYEMYDITGKQLRQGKVTGNETVIQISDLAIATYFLKIVTQNKVVKSFKIIKNN